MFTRLLFVVRSTTFSVTNRLFTVKPVLARSFHFSIYSWNFVQEPLALFSLGLDSSHNENNTHFYVFISSPLLPHALRLTHHLRPQYSLSCLLAPLSSLHAPCASPRTPVHVAPHACSIFCSVTTTPRFGSAPRHATFHYSVPRAAPQDSQLSAPERRKEKQKVAMQSLIRHSSIPCHTTTQKDRETIIPWLCA